MGGGIPLGPIIATDWPPIARPETPFRMVNGSAPTPETSLKDIDNAKDRHIEQASTASSYSILRPTISWLRIPPVNWTLMLSHSRTFFLLRADGETGSSFASRCESLFSFATMLCNGASLVPAAANKWGGLFFGYHWDIPQIRFDGQTMIDTTVFFP